MYVINMMNYQLCIFLIQVLSGKRTYVDVYWYKYFNNLRLIWKRWRIKRIAVSNFPFFRLNSSIGIFVFTKIICFLGILPYYNKLSRTIVHKVLASIALFKSRLKLLFTKNALGSRVNIIASIFLCFYQ